MVNVGLNDQVGVHMALGTPSTACPPATLLSFFPSQGSRGHSEESEGSLGPRGLVCYRPGFSVWLRVTSLRTLQGSLLVRKDGACTLDVRR